MAIKALSYLTKKAILSAKTVSSQLVKYLNTWQILSAVNSFWLSSVLEDPVAQYGTGCSQALSSHYTPPDGETYVILRPWGPWPMCTLGIAVMIIVYVAQLRVRVQLG